MATISGKYFLKAFEDGKLPEFYDGLPIEQDVNYTIYAYPFDGATVTGTQTCTSMKFRVDDSINFYSRDTLNWHNLRWNNCFVYHWERIIDFGSTPQTVKDNFYAYLSKYSVALTGENTLQGKYRVKSNLQLTNGVYFEYETGKYLICGMTCATNGTKYFDSSCLFTFINGTPTALTSGDTIEISTPITVSDYEKTVFDEAFELVEKPTYLRKDGAWVKQNAYERQNGEWVKISSAVVS